MSYFTFNDKKIYYEETGSGMPLLLLHGNTASSNMFAQIIDDYSKDFKVIVMDFLGHGQSDRLDKFPADLWFFEAQQVIEFLKAKRYKKVGIIGTSGGALVAINVALEAPGLTGAVVADSFEGGESLKEVVEGIKAERAVSKEDSQAKMFYEYMHGDDWEHIVDNDTAAVIEHDRSIGKFFHKPLSGLKSPILFTGTEEDEFVSEMGPDYFEKTFSNMIDKIGHGSIYLFGKGRHPAMLSNAEDFIKITKDFLIANNE